MNDISPHEKGRNHGDFAPAVPFILLRKHPNKDGIIYYFNLKIQDHLITVPLLLYDWFHRKLNHLVLRLIQ